MKFMERIQNVDRESIVLLLVPHSASLRPIGIPLRPIRWSELSMT